VGVPGPSSRRLRGLVRRTNPAELRELAEREFYRLSDDEAQGFSEAVNEALGLLDQLDDVPAPAIPIRHQRRDPGRAPTAEEDPLNAFTRLCRVEGAEAGPLLGMRVGVKDNIAVAGIPLTNGSRAMPFVPVEDACVIERILDAGAVIVGKLNMDEFGAAGTGEASAFGPTLNPVDRSRSAGGSSSGAGAAVVSGSVDLALGVDQGGSARIPAAYCGAVSLKPTHGLVPSHGATHIDHTIDAVCPIARTVELVATALDVMAGADDRDPQWVRGPIPTIRSMADLSGGVKGVTIGIVKESVDGRQCEPAVLAGLEAAEAAWSAGGATIRPVSVPLWPVAWPIEVALISMLSWGMAQSEGQGWGHLGRVDVERARHFALSRRLEGDNLPPFYKVWMLVGRYLHERYFSEHLGKAQNLRAALRAQIDTAFADCDLLVTPTTVGVAPLLSVPPVSEMEILARGTTMSHNTCPFNLSGHPAVAVPSGVDEDNLPVSVQIAAPQFEDARALRAARILHE
jgi:amidase